MTMTQVLPDNLILPRAAEPETGLRRSVAQDIDQHVEQLQDWNVRYDQLDCGRFEGSFTDIRWPGMQVFVETTTRRVRQRGHLTAESIGIATLIEGQGEIAVNAVRAGRDSLLLCDSAELDICTPAHCTVAGIVMESDVLRQTAQQSGVSLAVPAGALVSMTPLASTMRRWREVLVGATSMLTERPSLLADAAVRSRLQSDMVGALVDAVSSAAPDDLVLRPEQRKRIVDKACEMLLTRPDDPPSLAEVCLRVGASPRKLAYCFQDLLGVSPAKYVKSMRLNAVRRELARSSDPSLSIYDVAARWGFWHFGHFSSDYKKQFSELPSATLRRARGC